MEKLTCLIQLFRFNHPRIYSHRTKSVSSQVCLLPSGCDHGRKQLFKPDNVEVLVDFIASFKQVKSAFLMAFRHPSTNDPLCMACLLSRIVPRVSTTTEENIIQYPIHFPLYLWSTGNSPMGWKAQKWLYSRFGWIPIHRGKQIGLVAISSPICLPIVVYQWQQLQKEPLMVTIELSVTGGQA